MRNAEIRITGVSENTCEMRIRISPNAAQLIFLLGEKNQSEHRRTRKRKRREKIFTQSNLVNKVTSRRIGTE